MTVQTETSRSGPYAGSGTTGPFTVGFRFLDNTHLQVIRTSSAGVDTTLVITTDYSVSGAGGSSGTVTLVSALAVGETLTVIRDVPFTQLADYVDNDAFPAESHENALDLLTMQTQQNREVLGRSLTLPATTSGVSTELPVPESNKLIGWNETADALQNIDSGTLATIVAYGTASGDIFSGTGAQTVFTLGANPGALYNLDVSIGGVDQRPTLDYTWSAGTDLTFVVAPVAGTNNISVKYKQALPQGTADSAAVTYLPAGTGAVATTVQAKLRESVSVLDFGADPTGVADSTDAIQDAITAHNNVHIPAGTYRCDNSIVIDSSDTTRKSVTMTGSTKLRRLTAHSASTGPVIELIGNYGHFDGGMGLIESQNNSPRGVVALGHRDTDTLTLGNGLFWSFANCDVRCKNYVVAPTESTVVGVYIPSAQPNKGSSYANYFGTVSNVRVFDSGTAFWLTDQANAHTFVNCTVEFFWHYAWRFNGAYGNTVYGGFVNGCYQNAGIAMYFANRLTPAATYAASHQSIKNSIFGITVELYTTGNYGVYIDAAAGGLESGGNFIQFNWNSVGTSVLDGTTAKTNTILDGVSAFRLGQNLRIPDSTLDNVNLLQVGKNGTANHTIARTAASGTTVLTVENLSTVESTVYGLDVAWNTPSIGYSSGHIIGTYHAPTAAYRFRVMDTGNCQNTNNSYGAISDLKLKENIADASPKLAELMQVRIVNYNLKTEPDHKQIGVIAQELEQVFPGLVEESPDYIKVTKTREVPAVLDDEGVEITPAKTEEYTDREATGEVTKSVKYSVFVPMLIKAMQEQQALIDDLQTRLAALEAA